MFLSLTYFNKAMSIKARMTIDVDEDFRNEVKARASSVGQKLKDYVIEALKLKIQHDCELEDKHLGKIIDEAKEEGFLSKEDSSALLNKMRDA